MRNSDSVKRRIRYVCPTCLIIKSHSVNSRVYRQDPPPPPRNRRGKPGKCSGKWPDYSNSSKHDGPNRWPYFVGFWSIAPLPPPITVPYTTFPLVSRSCVLPCDNEWVRFFGPERVDWMRISNARSNATISTPKARYKYLSLPDWRTHCISGLKLKTEYPKLVGKHKGSHKFLADVQFEKYFPQITRSVWPHISVVVKNVRHNNVM